MAEKLIIKNARLSYAHLFKADAIAEGSEPKFSASIIIRKDDPQVANIKAALWKALQARFADKLKSGSWPSSLHNPLKDGDEMADDHPEYAGCWVLRSSSKTRPIVLGRRKEALTEEDGVIYSGCFCNFSLAAAAFDAQAKKGVTVYLNGVQFVQDGDRLAGFDATNDFDSLDEDEDNGDLPW